MPDLLLELFSEEIPARLQARAARDLERLVNERLLRAGFLPEGVKAFAGPRRLTVVATGLPVRQADRQEEKKGPRVGAPEAAVAGFLKSAGLASIDEAQIRDDKKGAFYVAVIDQKGRATADLIAEMVPEIVRGFPWPKSMRWACGDLLWVRPLRSILCVFDNEVVPFEIDGLASSDETHGHRTLAPGVIQVRTFEKYAAALKMAKVVLDPDERRERIAREAKTLCEAQGLQLVDDPGLLDEVAGLAEWPVPMIGRFDEKFLALPDEALSASMRGHQKYFSVRDPKTGRLANRFVFVANIEAPDGGAAMRAGYERVLTARLSDAWYLYNQDLKTPLGERIADLDRITFFEGLGTVGDKARRIAALAREIAPLVGADADLAERAALLAKADLTTAMVREFPELQGVMGRYYALAQGVDALRDAAARDTRLAAPQGEGARTASGSGPHRNLSEKLHPEEPRSGVTKDEALPQIADAIRDHYKPLGAEDDPPTAPVSVAVALADKIDTLAAFFSIGKAPTGSSDPFALRRAALGITNLILQNKVRIELVPVMNTHFAEGIANIWGRRLAEDVSAATTILEAITGRPVENSSNEPGILERAEVIGKALERAGPALMRFIHDRLAIMLREKGHRFDHVRAVIEAEGEAFDDDLVLIAQKLEVLEAFLDTDDGANLAAGYKRAANILKAEEKKGALPEAADLRETALAAPEEKALYASLLSAETAAMAAVQAEDFASAMRALASLRPVVDAFFDKVTVNADDSALRTNRLALLRRFIGATRTVADLSKLEG